MEHSKSVALEMVKVTLGATRIGNVIRLYFLYKILFSIYEVEVCAASFEIMLKIRPLLVVQLQAL